MSNTRQVFTFASDVVFQFIGGEGLLLGLHDEVVFALNASGARIAQLIGEKRDIESMVAILCGEFGAERDAIEPDVMQLIETLESRGLIERYQGAVR